LQDFKTVRFVLGDFPSYGGVPEGRGGYSPDRNGILLFWRSEQKI